MTQKLYSSQTVLAGDALYACKVRLLEVVSMKNNQIIPKNQGNAEIWYPRWVQKIQLLIASAGNMATLGYQSMVS